MSMTLQTSGTFWQRGPESDDRAAYGGVREVPVQYVELGQRHGVEGPLQGPTEKAIP